MEPEITGKEYEIVTSRSYVELSRLVTKYLCRDGGFNPWKLRGDLIVTVIPAMWRQGGTACRYTQVLYKNTYRPE